MLVVGCFVFVFRLASESGHVFCVGMFFFLLTGVRFVFFEMLCFRVCVFAFSLHFSNCSLSLWKTCSLGGSFLLEVDIVATFPATI